jgi:predicted HicB family RNase H-like nuclease
MPRIHYEIPDELHRRAKAAAALEGVTLKQYVVAALEAAVKKTKRR